MPDIANTLFSFSPLAINWKQLCKANAVKRAIKTNVYFYKT